MVHSFLLENVYKGTTQIEEKEENEVTFCNPFSENMSFFIRKLEETHDYLIQSAQLDDQLINSQENEDQLSIYIENSRNKTLKMLELMKLSINPLNVRDPSQLLQSFSQAAYNCIDALSMTIGIIDDPKLLSGIFYTTKVENNQIETLSTNQCVLMDTVLQSLYSEQNAVRYSKLSPSQLIVDNPLNLSTNRAFLGVPIQSATNTYGVIYFIGKRNATEFNEEDELLAAIIATELAALFDHIKGHDHFQQQVEKLQQEIAERKQIEVELNYKEELLKLTLDSGRMHCWEWRIQSNEMSEFGYIAYPAHQTYNTPENSFENFINSIIPEDREKVSLALNQAIQQSDVEVQIEYRSSIGESLQWIDFRGQIFYCAVGKPIRMIAVEVNITEHKKLEQMAHQQQAELAQIARVNSMGEIATTITNELANPLASINNHINDCIHYLENDVQVKELIIAAMRKALENVELAGEIIHRMKDFFRKGELHYETLTISEVITEAIKLIQYEVIHDSPITFVIDLPDNSLYVEADKIHIIQVVLNLIHNGIEAMREVKTKNPIITIRSNLKNLHTLVLSIEDNGPGIDVNTKELIFTPFYTTKSDGMGMGLAISHTIIEAHGGQLNVYNLPEGGASFQVTLPTMHNARHE